MSDADRQLRDQHGNPLPDEAGPTDLNETQIEEALAALPGWHRDGARVVRAVPVPRDSREALQEGVRNAVGDPSRVDFNESDAALTISLGGPSGGVRPEDLEAAARIDGVLSGSGTDRAS
jgi:hypothetical protein